MLELQRKRVISELRDCERYDLIVIGGGATGAGIVLDAASRGYRVALVEQEDFGSGTSSKSSKLIHGGVRYLAKGEFSLVREALRERAVLLNNAPHIVKPLNFIIPAKNFYELAKYSVGLWLYDRLAGHNQFGKSVKLSSSELRANLSALQYEKFRGAVKYSDGLFDDTRLLWDILRTAIQHGAKIANYCKVTHLIKHNKRVTGVDVFDKHAETHFSLHATAVINATGAWSDEISTLDNPNDMPSIVPSQGTHIVVSRDFFPADEALLIPRTSDGRVMFVIPWHGKVVIGTTDEQLSQGTTHAIPKNEEIELILRTAGNYLKNVPGRDDISACFAGIRPLSANGSGAKTAKISREHAIEVADSGLITISGGKWTTYRLMAEQCVNTFEQVSALPHRTCVTSSLALAQQQGAGEFQHYGDSSEAIRSLAAENPINAKPFTKELALSPAEVIFAVRHEMALTVMDVLARRTRALFLDAQAAVRIAPRVAAIMQLELNENEQWLGAQLEHFSEQSFGFQVN